MITIAPAYPTQLDRCLQPIDKQAVASLRSAPGSCRAAVHRRYVREKRCLRGVPLSAAAMTKGFWGQEWIDLFDKATRLSDYSKCPEPSAEGA